MQTTSSGCPKRAMASPTDSSGSTSTSYQRCRPALRRRSRKRSPSEKTRRIEYAPARVAAASKPGHPEPPLRVKARVSRSASASRSLTRNMPGMQDSSRGDVAGADGVSSGASAHPADSSKARINKRCFIVFLRKCPETGVCRFPDGCGILCGGYCTNLIS